MVLQPRKAAILASALGDCLSFAYNRGSCGCGLSAPAAIHLLPRCPGYGCRNLAKKITSKKRISLRPKGVQRQNSSPTVGERRRLMGIYPPAEKFILDRFSDMWYFYILIIVYP